MGIITRLYHRSEDLADNRFNVFFLDMGENIHIHYRDLRIELSTNEFLEFVELFNVYAPLVKGEIDRGYRDGVHPNTNQTNTLTTFSNKKPLKHSICYNPNRISIEENIDGYHIHLRNYKILLDKPSFASFVRAAKEIVAKRELPIDLDEALELIEVNELPHHVSERVNKEGKEQAVVTVEKPYFRKTQQLLEGLKYTKIDLTAEAAVYEKGNERICLRIGALPRVSLSARVNSTLVPLAEYIKRNAKKFTPEDINLLKLQYLDTSKYVGKNKLENLVELNHDHLIYDVAENRIIFPSRTTDDHALDANKVYDQFMIFLKEQGLSFIKPGKIPYSDAESGRLQSVFNEYVKEVLGKHPCVSKVYLFNAESKKRSGRYQVPFVHFDWAKLGSDFDLLIEIDERFPVPNEWAYKFFWKACSSDYYLLGDIDFPVQSPFIEQYKNVDFYHHLVEAYLYFGSKGNQAVKNEYLKKHNAKLLYKKADGRPMVETVDLLQTFLVQNYDIEPTGIEKLDVPSFNEVFRITTQDREFAVKLMKREDFTPAVAGHSGRHLEYEAQLLDALSGRELPVVSPLPGKNGQVLQQFENRFCMLFPFLTSDKESMTLENKIRAVAKSLALLHQALATADVAKDWYRFDEALDYWINQFDTLYEKFSENNEETEQYRSLSPRMKEAGQRILAAKNLPWIHSHGDICPRNIFYANGEAVIFDFQVAHSGPRIEDVAEGALEFALNGSELDQKLVDEFVSAYGAVNLLSAVELELIPTMLFLQSAFKLARAFRVQVLFGYKVDKRRVMELLKYALQ